jgi:hypothetical protein
MLTLKPPPSQKDTKTQPCMSDKPASTSRWAVARTADRARDAQGADVAGWEGIPLAKVRHKCLKRLDSEKTMKGNERSFTASRAFHGAPPRRQAVLQIPLPPSKAGTSELQISARKPLRTIWRRQCLSALMEVVEAGQIGNSGCCRRDDTPCSALAAVRNATRPSRPEIQSKTRRPATGCRVDFRKPGH